MTPGVEASNVIPIDELVIGTRDGRFYVRWPALSCDVTICAGHMLNVARAPTVCRLLSDIGRDRVVQLSSFGWGPASNFPFLPRVEFGRIVLRPAQWSIDAANLARNFSFDNAQNFSRSLANWRQAWNVPRHVYMSEQDNRLLLDLDNASHVEELRHAAKAVKSGARLTLEEVFPTLRDAWVRGEGGHYMAEIVVSLVRSLPSVGAAMPRLHTSTAPALRWSAAEPTNTVPPAASVFGNSEQRLRPPGASGSFSSSTVQTRRKKISS